MLKSTESFLNQVDYVESPISQLSNQLVPGTKFARPIFYATCYTDLRLLTRNRNARKIMTDTHSESKVGSYDVAVSTILRSLLSNNSYSSNLKTNSAVKKPITNDRAIVGLNESSYSEVSDE